MSKIKLGDRVYHDKYGVGRVIRIEEDIYHVLLDIWIKNTREIFVREEEIELLTDAIRIGDRVETHSYGLGTIRKMRIANNFAQYLVELDIPLDDNLGVLYLFPYHNAQGGFRVLKEERNKKIYKPRLSPEVVRKELEICGVDISTAKDEHIKELTKNILEKVELWMKNCGYYREVRY